MAYLLLSGSLIALGFALASVRGSLSGVHAKVALAVLGAAAIARLLVDHGRVRSERERAWVAVDGELEVEEWQILGVKGP